MKKVYHFLLMAGAVTGMAFGLAGPSLPIGSDLPKNNIRLKDVSGKEISLQEQLKPNGILVMFSCNTCPVVRGYQGRTRAICEYAAEKNLGVVLLNSNEANRESDESLESMRDYANSQQYKWFYAVDKKNELADAFGASRTPECFVFNANAKLVYKGAIDDNPGNPDGVKREYLKMAIDEMIGGKEVTVKETRSIGCSIKRLK